MLVRDFQYISTLDSGSTTYEYNLVHHFGIDTNQPSEEVGKELLKKMTVNVNVKLPKVIKFNGKKWKILHPFLEQSYEQWARMEILISEGDNVKNLHKILAVYMRPCNWRGKIVPFDLKTQDKIEEELLDLPMDIAQSLMVFFYLFAKKHMDNIKTFYLNEMKLIMEKKEKASTPDKSTI